MTPAALRPIVGWFTLQRAAAECDRSEKTIRNLISKHQLPRLLRWSMRNRRRVRVVWISPETLAQLQRLTLDKPE